MFFVGFFQDLPTSLFHYKFIHIVTTGIGIRNEKYQKTVSSADSLQVKKNHWHKRAGESCYLTQWQISPAL